MLELGSRSRVARQSQLTRRLLHTTELCWHFGSADCSWHTLPLGAESGRRSPTDHTNALSLALPKLRRPAREVLESRSTRAQKEPRPRLNDFSKGSIGLAPKHYFEF